MLLLTGKCHQIIQESVDILGLLKNIVSPITRKPVTQCTEEVKTDIIRIVEVLFSTPKVNEKIVYSIFEQLPVGRQPVAVAGQTLNMALVQRLKSLHIPLPETMPDMQFTTQI
ncbi:hypothetical protein D3C87_1645590 [compost metagenome]